MENVKRILPYVRRYVLMAIYDVLDEESISYHKKDCLLYTSRCV